MKRCKSNILLQNYLLDNFAVLLKFERSEENRSMVNPTIEKRRPSLAILRKKNRCLNHGTQKREGKGHYSSPWTIFSEVFHIGVCCQISWINIMINKILTISWARLKVPHLFTVPMNHCKVWVLNFHLRCWRSSIQKTNDVLIYIFFKVKMPLSNVLYKSNLNFVIFLFIIFL